MKTHLRKWSSSTSRRSSSCHSWRRNSWRHSLWRHSLGWHALGRHILWGWRSCGSRYNRRWLWGTWPRIWRWLLWWHCDVGNASWRRYPWGSNPWGSWRSCAIRKIWWHYWRSTLLLWNLRSCLLYLRGYTLLGWGCKRSSWQHPWWLDGLWNLILSPTRTLKKIIE